MTYFDTAHYVHTRAGGGGFYLQSQVHKSVEEKGNRIEATRPWSSVLATCHDHTLNYNWRGEVYDHVPIHGTVYIGKAMCEREAVALWKNHLLSIGVHAEDAEVRDDL